MRGVGEGGGRRGWGGGEGGKHSGKINTAIVLDFQIGDLKIKSSGRKGRGRGVNGGGWGGGA